MNVDDVIAQKIEAARRREAAEREARARRQRARDAGLTARYRRKIAYLDQFDNASLAASGAV